MVPAKVFPLEQHFRPLFLDGRNKFFNKLIIFPFGDAAMADAEIQRVCKQFFIVSAHIEKDRQGC